METKRRGHRTELMTGELFVGGRVCESDWMLQKVKWYSVPIYIQQDATLHSLFISGNCSTCFAWYHHPSSGVHTTVSTASGICHTVTATKPNSLITKYFN